MKKMIKNQYLAIYYYIVPIYKYYIPRMSYIVGNHNHDKKKYLKNFILLIYDNFVFKYFYSCLQIFNLK